MIFVWIGIAVVAVAMVAIEIAVNGPRVGPVDISDPDGEDKWGAM